MEDEERETRVRRNTENMEVMKEEEAKLLLGKPGHLIIHVWNAGCHLRPAVLTSE